MNLRVAAIAGAVTPLLLTVGIAVTSAAAALDTTACMAAAPVADLGGADVSEKSLTTAQRGNARLIYTVGVQLGVPYRGEVIALATALQESRLTNHSTATDHDSLGLFQQRPSQGWGTPAQILNPVYATTAFYSHLIRIINWERLPLTDAAQAVQRSAYPDAYAKWEPLASRLADDAAHASGQPITQTSAPCSPNCRATVAPTDVQSCQWVAPVRAPVVSGFRTPSRPGHDGVDLGAARGTPIHAASAGTVIIVRCNIRPASYGCNRDGSIATPGCGWYVDLQHADQIITRYCHMLIRPTVNVGESVTTGQVIGYVGSSGHSSGPHLHFEVHLKSDRSPAGAIDAVPFMRQRGTEFGA